MRDPGLESCDYSSSVGAGHPIWGSAEPPPEMENPSVFTPAKATRVVPFALALLWHGEEARGQGRDRYVCR